MQKNLVFSRNIFPRMTQLFFFFSHGTCMVTVAAGYWGRDERPRLCSLSTLQIPAPGIVHQHVEQWTTEETVAWFSAWGLQEPYLRRLRAGGVTGSDLMSHFLSFLNVDKPCTAGALVRAVALRLDSSSFCSKDHFVAFGILFDAMDHLKTQNWFSTCWVRLCLCRLLYHVTV
jgi:hypothetical protein